MSKVTNMSLKGVVANIFASDEDPPPKSLFDLDKGAPYIEAGGHRIESRRESRRYGKVSLSIQASEYMYCEPRASGLHLKDYTAVEIAMISEGRWLRPSDLIDYNGPTDEEIQFEDGGPAGYVPQEVVRRLERALYEWLYKGGTLREKVETSGVEDENI